MCSDLQLPSYIPGGIFYGSTLPIPPVLNHYIICLLIHLTQTSNVCWWVTASNSTHRRFLTLNWHASQIITWNQLRPWCLLS